MTADTRQYHWIIGSNRIEVGCIRLRGNFKKTLIPAPSDDPFARASPGNCRRNVCQDRFFAHRLHIEFLEQVAQPGYMYMRIHPTGDRYTRHVDLLRALASNRKYVVPTSHCNDATTCYGYRFNFGLRLVQRDELTGENSLWRSNLPCRFAAA
jgi:hypothetical protein